MKTLTTLSTLSLLALATFSTGCLNLAGLRAAAYGVDEDRCEVFEEACEDFIIVTCDKVESCGGEFDECVGVLFDGGFDCEHASDLDEDPEECFEEIEAMTCDELASGDDPRACVGIEFGFDEDICG